MKDGILYCIWRSLWLPRYDLIDWWADNDVYVRRKWTFMDYFVLSSELLN